MMEKFKTRERVSSPVGHDNPELGVKLVGSCMASETGMEVFSLCQEVTSHVRAPSNTFEYSLSPSRLNHKVPAAIPLL